MSLSCSKSQYKLNLWHSFVSKSFVPKVQPSLLHTFAACSLEVDGLVGELVGQWVGEWVSNYMSELGGKWLS